MPSSEHVLPLRRHEIFASGPISSGSSRPSSRTSIAPRIASGEQGCTIAALIAGRLRASATKAS